MYKEYKLNFDEADVGNKGYLTINEFDQYISIDDSLGDKEKQEIIKVADVNNDGEISFNEFAKFLDHDGN